MLGPVKPQLELLIARSCSLLAARLILSDLYKVVNFVEDKVFGVSIFHLRRQSTLALRHGVTLMISQASSVLLLLGMSIKFAEERILDLVGSETDLSLHAIFFFC